MSKFIWLTDIHLESCFHPKRKEFYESLREHNIPLLITGDIGNSRTITQFLKEIAREVSQPFYFVLGNHDYYGSNVEELRKKIGETCENYHLPMRYLTPNGPHVLSNGTVICGVDGWADGLYGNYEKSKVVLNDSRYIEDFKWLSKDELKLTMQKFARKDAIKLIRQIESMLEVYQLQKIIVLTHVPPFPESATYDGKISDDDHLPFFASKIMGDTLIRIANQYPHIEFTVLCGHSHGKTIYQPLPNLIVKTGAAEYGSPQIQEIIEI